MPMQQATSARAGADGNALNGIQVLDLTQSIAGPHCTSLLAGFGAQVVKVEPPWGEPARRLGPFPKDQSHPERSGTFLYLNQNKLGVTLDLKAKRGAAIFKELVAGADAVVENFEPRVMPSLGLDYETLARINPRLVMTSISTFGQTGPYRDYHADELVAYSMGGLTYVIGLPDREPVKSGGNQAQFQAGLNAAIWTAAALYFQRLTGQGQHIDVSIMQTVMNLVEFGIAHYTHTGKVFARNGNRWRTMKDANGAPLGHPTEVYRCKDGFINLAVQAPNQWEMLTLMLGRPELREDPRFDSWPKRGQHTRELDDIVGGWCRERTQEEIFKLCGEYRIPCGYTYTMTQLPQDPQFKERGYFQQVDHPEAGPLLYPGGPFRPSEFGWQMGRAPLLGEHNAQVYGEWLGYSKRKLSGLRRAGVI
ncbi:MAG: CoA transferase [Chloroflexi bacterium]|nr:CoA transferase [Chloroflexota bacterium]